MLSLLIKLPKIIAFPSFELYIIHRLPIMSRLVKPKDNAPALNFDGYLVTLFYNALSRIFNEHKCLLSGSVPF